ncbi:MAG: hypothetical protein NPIRA02_02560 [Nitrospirales bacterium]|nr:MAG: hypothetical protein NPIRA02_02560 [Nitrospirales bacterium]
MEHYLVPTSEAFQQTGLSNLFRELLVGRYWQAPRYGEYQLFFLKHIGKNNPIVSAPKVTRVWQTWMEQYPKVFHEALETLASIEADAQKIASSVLSTYLPDPQAIRRELHYLDEKIAGTSEKHRSSLVKRKKNLTARLNKGRSVTPRRMHTLRVKLERALKRAVVRNWEQALDTRFVQEWPRFLGLDYCPSWLFDLETLQTLLPIVQLKASQRTLALRLIRIRTGVPPWDLRDDPANQRFLQLLTQQGVNMDPWINGIGTIEHHTDDGHSCFLALEEDPLEIFRMGAHFQTCLGPGEFNFFSVFANAADINKRVLYGRDGNGKVIGRTLFALTNQGGLVPFHIYCHNPKTGYPQAVTAFVKRLAKRMRTIILSDGTIDTLVSRDWYDDGPIDLGCRFLALEERSAFRTQLLTIDPKSLPSLLKETFAPIPLNELTIPLVLELPEFLKTHTLARPLLDIVANVNRLPLETYLRSLRIALHASIQEYAFSRIGKYVIKKLLQKLRQDEYVSEQDLGLVVQCHPGNALTLLKRTRLKGVRRWEDEGDQNRQMWIIQALTLGRTKQANDLMKVYSQR